MELRHLRYFCAVAEWQGFSKAARALRVSQSAISEQILDLEKEIGVLLLNRVQHRVSLTPAGEIFYGEAKKLLAGAERAVDLAQRSMRGELGSLTIGFLIWGAGAFFPSLIRGFRKLYPEVRLRLVEMLPPDQSKALVEGTLDVGFTRPLEPPYDRQLRSELLYLDSFVAVVPLDHPLAERPLELRQLANEPFVICDRSASPTLFDKITALCAQAGFSPRISQTANLLASVLTLVQAGEGVTLIPASLRSPRFHDLSFCPLIAPTGVIELVMAWPPEREGTVLHSFLEFIRRNEPLIRGYSGGR
jgi:DNA-binding transcriptional LysR family regulator